MKILYITEDYFYSKVHHQLLSSLKSIDKNKVDITVINIFRTNNGVKNISKNYSNINYELISIENKSNPLRYKIDFQYKIRWKYYTILNSIEVSRFDLIVASTLYSDGAVAYKLSNYYKKPYTTAIRGTDLSLYFNKMYHLWPLGVKILKNARQLYFISPCLFEKLKSKICFLKKLKHEVESKSYVIPNGIDKFWLDNLLARTTKLLNQSDLTCHLIFIGRLDYNKNIKRVIKAYNVAKKERSDIEFKLSIIGEVGYYEEFVKKAVYKDDSITYLGPIYDKTSILQLLRQCDVFVMPSHSETFGLVYIEALSQGLSIIYTEEQGIDGYFENVNIGEKVKSKSITSIKDGILKSLDYDEYVGIEKQILDFDWSHIAKKYYHNYEKIIF